MEQDFQKILTGFVAVGTGSFLGGGLRYLFDSFMARLLGPTYPWGTFTVNLLGCFLLGLLISFGGRQHHAEAFFLLLTTGFCGGFTTFSTYVKEGFLFFQQGQVILALGYLLLSVFLGMLFFYLGFFCAR